MYTVHVDMLLGSDWFAVGLEICTDVLHALLAVSGCFCLGYLSMTMSCKLSFLSYYSSAFSCSANL